MDRFGRLVGFVYVDKTERALEEFLDVLFADEFGSEEFVEIEIGEAAIGDAGWEQLQQELCVDLAKRANFFKDDAVRGVDKFFGIDQPAEFDARDGLYEDGAEEAEEVSLGGDVFRDVGDAHRSWEDVASAG